MKTGNPFRAAMLVHGETFEMKKKNHLLMFGRLSFFARGKFLIVIYSEQATEISSSREPAGGGRPRPLRREYKLERIAANELKNK